MINRAAAIIKYKEGIILIKRQKGYGDEKIIYYTVPGGGIEENEEPKEAVIREAKEELGIEIELIGKTYEFLLNGKKEYFYEAKYVRGILGTGIGEEMQNPDYDKYGSFTIEIIKKEDIKNINLLPQEIKNIIMLLR